MLHPNFPVVVLFIASILWGLSWLPLKTLSGLGIEGLPFILVCHAFLAVIFAVISGGKVKQIKSHFLPLLTTGLVGGGAILSFTLALIYGEVIRVMVLFYLLPVWGVLGGIIFLREKSELVRWFAVGLALFGAFLILGGSKIFKQAPSLIDLLALVSGLLFAATNLLFRGVESVPLNLKLFSMMLGCALLAGLMLLFGLQRFPVSLPASTWIWVLIYASTWLFFANLGSMWAVTKMEAGRSSVIIIMELVAAVVSSLLLTGDRLNFWEWLGCLAVVVAAFLEALKANHGEA